MAFKSSFVTGVFWFTSISEPVTSYSELSSFTVTFTFTVSFEPSLYVTSTTPSFSPGMFVSGVVVHLYLVPSGKPEVFTLVAASGVAP